MSDRGGLEGLETLHRDLLALSELRLLNVERLWIQLEARIEEFRHLLDKPPRNEHSRKGLETGKLQVQDEEFAINEEFQQTALQVAEALDLDELDSARILLEAQEDSDVLGRSLLESSIITYYQTRKYLLDCFRLILQQSIDINSEENIRDAFQDVVRSVLQTEGPSGTKTRFVRKCLQNMGTLKIQLFKLAERVNGESVLGQTAGGLISETLDFQRISLVQQHESCGIILHYLIKANHSISDDFDQLLDVLKRADKYDNLLEARIRTKLFTDALKDGAFDFILSLSADVKSAEWHDPARHGLRQWLQRKCPPLIPDAVPFSDQFQTVLMEQLETFVDAFITHMPDVLRKLRVDEDEQRQLSLTHDHDLDLERFLVIISFAFEGRPDAAQVFWSDSDSNLAGFLQWSSRRTTTPLLSAFCDMLQALSEDELCASKAHEFLLGEVTSSSGRMTRSQSLNWARIFRELTFYSSSLRDRPSQPQSTFYRGGKHDQAEAEPESAMMLESYLRLIARLCTESPSARAFLFEHPTFSITDLLYQLASSDNAPSRLRACAFTSLRSLLSHKSKATSDFIWKSLDAWISGGYSATGQLTRTSPSSDSSGPVDGVLQRIFESFEECNAFILLLNALVVPYDTDLDLNDSLPFPELLGSSSRMPGIDPYIDFVAHVFRSKPADTPDIIQQRLLSLACLDFFDISLSTFNEDLLVFANQSNISVDSAIRTSDLSTYVRLHPFSRVMEWIFNDGVMAALFAALHQDIVEVCNASPDSLLISCMMRALHVVIKIMELQATYLDIVRPIVKLQATHRKHIVANAAFATFEDGVLNNLSIITDLGLYCGAGHALLCIESLRLLEMLSASPKLVGPSQGGLGRQSGRNKAIVALELNNDSERIARSLVNELLSNLELDQGPGSDAYMIKTHILNFLDACLEATTNSPSIAHLLLGFQCTGHTVDINLDSLFARGASLFHAILSLVMEYPVADEMSGVLYWAIALKNRAIQVLHTLWKSSLSSHFVMAELRANDFMVTMFAKEPIIDSRTLWDGRVVEEEEFLPSSSSRGLFDFMRHRTSILQYTALELQCIARESSPSLRDRALMILQGLSTIGDEQHVENPSVFDLFDFMELEVGTHNEPPQLAYFKDIDMSVCLESRDDALVIYSPSKVQNIVALRQSELQKTGQLQIAKDETAFENEASILLTCIEIGNQSRRLRESRIRTLEAWVQLMLMVVETGGLEGTKKTSFILQAFQVITPKFEKFSIESIDEALMLATLVKHLIFSIDFNLPSFQKGDMGDVANDRLFQVFRVCLRAIHSPIGNTQLKEVLYSICYRYLSGMSDISRRATALRRHSTYTVKAAGERLIDVICDDAYSGEQTCRISALLLLSALVILARQEDSKYIVEALVRLNFIGLVVDSIKTMLAELRNIKEDEAEMQLSFYQAKLALLLHVSQTRFGATAVVNAGIFRSVKASELFSIDPDLGVDTAGLRTAKSHYALLLAVMRVINASILSRGEQNELSLSQGRGFLSENRLSVLTVFKKSMNIGTSDFDPSDETIEDLAESYMLLVTLTGFIDFDDHRNPSREPLVAFT